MKITIITVVFNRVGSIERAVQSVQSQNYTDVEHIVVDGGSTDGTLQKLKACLGKNSILVSEPDRGMYDALNKGLRLATGDVIGVLHSDDYFESDHVLSLVVAEFQEKSIDVVYGDAVFFSGVAPEQVKRHYSSARFKPSRLRWGLMPAHTTLFLRRECCQNIGEYKLGYAVAADFDFVCRLFSTAHLRYSYIPKVLVKMQTGGLSAAGWKNTLMMNKEVMRACRENGIQTSWLKLLCRYPLKILEFLWRR